LWRWGPFESFYYRYNVGPASADNLLIATLFVEALRIEASLKNNALEAYRVNLIFRMLQQT
jgi:hypothetical protein